MAEQYNEEISYTDEESTSDPLLTFNEFELKARETFNVPDQQQFQLQYDPVEQMRHTQFPEPDLGKKRSSAFLLPENSN